MSDKDDVLEIEFFAQLNHVGRVALERAVLDRVVRGHIRTPGADVVEQHDPVPRLEHRSHEAPHVLIAPEAVRKNYRSRAATPYVDIVSIDDRHALPPVDLNCHCPVAAIRS